LFWKIRNRDKKDKNGAFCVENSPLEKVGSIACGGCTKKAILAEVSLSGQLTVIMSSCRHEPGKCLTICLLSSRFEG